MKFLIFLGTTIGGGVGNVAGHAIDHNQYYLGIWDILLGAIGSLVGIYIAYKGGQYFGM